MRKPVFNPKREIRKVNSDTLHIHFGEMYQQLGIESAKRSLSMTEFVRQAVTFAIENLPKGDK